MEATLKNLIYVLLMFIFFITSAYSQQKDSLIQLYPGLGNTIDQFDRNYFELFQNIEGYQHAVFYIRNGEELISKVSFKSNDVKKDTAFIQKLSALDDARQKIGEIRIENEKKYESPREFLIETKNGTKYICEIEMFSKTMIYCNASNNSKFKIDHTDIETLTLTGETNTWSCMGYGALIGLGIGLIGAVASNEGYALIFGTPIVTILGGMVGLIAGIFTSTGDEVYSIDYQNDLIQLKPFVKYYFRYDESVEEEYVEIE